MSDKIDGPAGTVMVTGVKMPCISCEQDTWCHPRLEMCGACVFGEADAALEFMGEWAEVEADAFGDETADDATPERVSPFSNGSEFSAWKDRNCDSCALRWKPSIAWRCELEEALDFAYLEDGTIAADIAERLGCNADPDRLDWPSMVCPEKRKVRATKKVRLA